MPSLTNRLKLSLPLSNEYVQREVLVKAFEEIDRLVMLQGDLDTLKRAVNKYTDDSIKTLKDETENKVGKPNGIAGLDKDGKVPITQLPKREAKDVNLADEKGYYPEKTVESALQQVGADLAETDKKSQLLQQGLNVLNAPVASSLNIEIQGRTLVNLLGQTNLDNTKYYVFVPQKGTTKISYGGNTYEGVTKFTGQATVSYSIKQDLRGKVAGSTVDNGHSVKRTSFTTGASTVLLKPSEFTLEPTNSDYELLSVLDNKSLPVSNASNGAISQQLFSFNIIRALEDKCGPQIWQGKTALADKVTIARQVITKIVCNWWGNGSSPAGNKASLAKFDTITNEWGNKITNSTTTPSKISSAGTSNYTIGSDGFAQFLAYAEPSNGTVASVINTDYVELELEVNTSLPLLEDALYEVDQATYNKINVDPEYSGQKLLDKFPYVQGVQHLNPLVTVEGGNLIPPLSNATTSTTSIGSFEVESSYKAIVKATSNFADFNLNLNTPCVGGQTYAFSCLDLKGWFSIRTADASGKEISRYDIKTGMNTFKFTVPENAKMFIFWFGNNAAGAGTFYIEQPMLVLGDKPKPFTPRNPSYLYTNTVLAGQNGINDVLYQDDGQWKLLRKWGDEQLSDKEWNFIQAYAGFKRFECRQSLIPNRKGIVLKYNNAVLTLGNTSLAPDVWDDDTVNLKISASNTDTGFSDNFNPNGDEIRAYFNGWKVKTADANGKPIAWKSVVDDKDAPTQTLAYVRANRAPNYTPYKLTYQLATPRVEAVIVEGDLAVSGLTQVAVDSGVVVREKTSVYVTSSTAWINRIDLPNSRLLNRNRKIISIYKNGVDDTSNWGFTTNNSNSYGTYVLWREISKHDPTAEYTVTYLVQDKHQFTTNPIDVKATYNQSLKTSVTELVEKQADTATGLSILANATSENTKDIVALKKATADNTTDITELKNKMNTNSTKLDKHLESLSRFRSSKDDNGIFRTLEWKTKSGVLRRKAVITMHPTTGDYDKQTVAEYADDGKTITKVEEYKLILDGDGDIVNEVLQ